jgi:hypothetical protein
MLDALGGLMNEVAKKRGLPWWAWVLIALAALFPIMGILSALAIYGVSKYVKNAKASEARRVVPVLANGIARCSASGLPPTSNAVPSAAPPGKRYQSAATDWSSQPAFRCAGFGLSEPQYFSYRWQLESPTRGLVIALADLNADGVPDMDFEQPVECSAGAGCTAGALRELRGP